MREDREKVGGAKEHALDTVVNGGVHPISRRETEASEIRTLPM